MFHISFYVPLDHKEKVKEAMFAAGAGRIGNYAECCFEVRGIGQFRPLSGSRPFVGKDGEVEFVTEVKIELVCEKESLEASIDALKKSHPYETPAYYVIEMVGI
jgi:hypothetical protein